MVPTKAVILLLCYLRASVGKIGTTAAGIYKEVDIQRNVENDSDARDLEVMLNRKRETSTSRIFRTHYLDELAKAFDCNSNEIGIPLGNRFRKPYRDIGIFDSFAIYALLILSQLRETRLELLLSDRLSSRNRRIHFGCCLSSIYYSFLPRRNER